MKSELSFKTAVCSEYERLLKKCQGAFQNWNERRQEICEAHLSGKEVGNELLRLQADYAKAYSLIRRHIHDCELCQFVSKMGGRESTGNLNVLFFPRGTN